MVELTRPRAQPRKKKQKQKQRESKTTPVLSLWIERMVMPLLKTIIKKGSWF